MIATAGAMPRSTFLLMVIVSEFLFIERDAYGLYLILVEKTKYRSLML